MTQEEKDFFGNDVRAIAAMVPPGRATSYGAIARAVGYPHLSRMVGIVMSALGHDSGIPAHRVVNSEGKLTGRAAFGPGNEMADRLAADGVEVADDRIRDWKNVFWDPQQEINI